MVSGCLRLGCASGAGNFGLTTTWVPDVVRPDGLSPVFLELTPPFGVTGNATTDPPGVPLLPTIRFAPLTTRSKPTVSSTRAIGLRIAIATLRRTPIGDAFADW